MVGEASYTHRLKGSIRRRIEQVRLFGPVVLLNRLTGRRPIDRLTLRGFGPIHVRLDSTDAPTFAKVFLHREYDLSGLGEAEARIDARYRAILASGRDPVIVDAGANVGAATLWFGRRFPDAAIVAIEPEPANAAVLRRNVEGRPNVTVIEAAISSEPGFVGFASSATGDAVQTERAVDGVRAVTIQNALDAVPNGVAFMAKIDIEGFESDLFATDLDWIDSMAMVVIEPHDWMMPGRFTSANFQAAMGARRFEVFINGENLIYVAA